MSVVVGDCWRFTKTDFVECPVCARSVHDKNPEERRRKGKGNSDLLPTTQIKICNVAKHFKKVHPHQPDLVNQVRGCQGCGDKNVPVQVLEGHQGCGREKSMGVKCATDNDASQQAAATTNENYVGLTPAKVSEDNGPKWIKLNYINEVNGSEEMKVRRRKSVEGQWAKLNIGKWKKFKVHPSDLKYTYQGKELDGLATPQSLGMQDGDVVTVEMRDKEEDISIKFFSSDLTFFKTVKKTTRMKEIKGDVSRKMGVERSDIKLVFKDKEVGLYATPALLLMRQNDVILVSKSNEAPAFPTVSKRKAIEGSEQGTQPKVQKQNQDVTKDPEIFKLTASTMEVTVKNVEEDNVDNKAAEQDAIDKDEFKSIEEKIREQALKRVMAKDAERKKKEMGGLIVE